MTEFGNEWVTDKLICSKFTRISGKTFVSELSNDLRMLKTGPIFRCRSEPSSFTGRQQELQDIRSAYQDYRNSSHGNSKKRLLVIQGMPGVGKSSLVSNFIHENMHELKDECHVLWIPADTKASILDTFREICEDHFFGLRKELQDENGTLKNIKHVMEKIYERLCRSPSLIVFDNAACEEPQFSMRESIDDFLCKSVPSYNFLPFYIVTTRTASPLVWQSPPWTCLQLDTFTAEESWAYMQTALKTSQVHKQDFMKLSEFFDHLPIAIEHNLNAMKYEAELLGQTNLEYFDPRPYIQNALQFVPVAAVQSNLLPESSWKLSSLWEYSLKLLRNTRLGRAAESILEVLSVLSSTGVPVKFLNAILKNYETAPEDGALRFDPDVITSAIHLLRLFSIVQRPNEYLHVHVLLQEHVGRRMRSRDLDHLIRQIVRAMFRCPEFTSYSQENYAANFRNLESICRAVAHYVSPQDDILMMKCAKFLTTTVCLPRVVIELLESLLPDSLLEGSKRHSSIGIPRVRSKLNPDPELISLLSTCYLQVGDFEAAFGLLMKYIEKEGIEGHKDSRERPQLLIGLAKAQFLRGNFEDAIKWCQQAEETLPACEDMDKIRIQNLRANTLFAMGKLSESLVTAKEVHRLYHVTFGADHKNTLQCKANLANIHFKLGHIQESLQLGKEVDEAHCKLLGLEHPDSLNLKTNLAAFYAEAGNIVEALKLSNMVKDSCCTILGTEHPDTLCAKSNLATFYAEAGNHDEALRLCEEIYEAESRILGADHPDSLSSKNNLAGFQSEAGNFEKALEICQEVYEARWRIFGPNHAETLISKSNMAGFHAAAGNFADAVRLGTEASQALREVLGVDHPDYLRSKRDVATFYSDSGNFEAALQVSEEVYEALCRVHGPNHPVSLTAKTNMAVFHAEVGKFREAIRICESVYEVQCTFLGPEHSDSLTSKSNLAAYHSEAGNFGLAIRFCEEVVVTQEKTLGLEHPDTLSSKSDLASFYSENGDLEQAIRLSEKVIEARCRVLGVDHPDFLSSKSNLANRYLENGREEDALRLCEEVYNTRIRALGVTHPQTLESKSNLAGIYFQVGNSEEALRLGKEVYLDFGEALGQEHPQTLIAKHNLASFHAQVGNNHEAFQLCNEVYRARCATLGPEHPDSLSSKSNLAIRYSDIGDLREALRLSEEVYEAECLALGPDHPNSLSSKEQMAVFRNRLGRCGR